MYLSGSKSLTSQAKRTCWLEALNFVIGAAPDRPPRSPCQEESTSFPTGVTRPSPVTTTRCGKLLSHLFVEIRHGIADGAELFRFLVGDIDVELLLERHHQLNGVETVAAEIFHETGIARELLAFDAELFDNDILDLLFHVAHVSLE